MIRRHKFASGIEVEWKPIGEFTAEIFGTPGTFCRFCLENGKEVGMIIGAHCSAGCEGNKDFIRENIHRIRTMGSVSEIVDRPTVRNKSEEHKDMSEKQDYNRHPRSPFSFGTRTDRIFSKIALSGNEGVMIEDVVSGLKEERDEQGLEGDVRTKISQWYKGTDKFDLVTDKRPQKGRPSTKGGGSTDRRVAIVWNGETAPGWAVAKD